MGNQGEQADEAGVPEVRGQDQDGGRERRDTQRKADSKEMSGIQREGSAETHTQGRMATHTHTEQGRSQRVCAANGDCGAQSRLDESATVLHTSDQGIMLPEMFDQGAQAHEGATRQEGVRDGHTESE